nr:hypothetical protein [Tanacetum cinerariifolium]
VADVLAKRDATRSRNSEDNHDSRTGVSRQAPLAREYTYSDFMKCKPLNFKDTEGVVKTVDHDVAYAMTWTNLKKKMTDKMFPEESYKIERYVSGLPNMIHGSVMASKPKTMQDAIEFANELMEKKISTLTKRQAENKRKLDNNNQTQQQPPKKKGVAIAYTVRPGKRNESPATTNNQRNPTFYECGNQGHYKSDCPELKNQNHENQAGGTGARGMVHALGGQETNQDLNDIEDEINA